MRHGFTPCLASAFVLVCAFALMPASAVAQGCPPAPHSARISAGVFQTLALRSDGTVMSWGFNQFGQLGLGNTTDQNTPQQIPASALSGVIALAAGEVHSLALKSDGTLMSWGYNGYGQLGLGNNPQYNTPQQIPASALSGVIALAAGARHSLALKSDGTVMAWGNSAFGQLGLGNNTPYNTPQQIPPSMLSGVIALAAGPYHSLALKSGGTVMAWGWNSNGQLGLGNTTQYNTPQQIPASALSGVIALTAGLYHSLVLKSDGTLMSWGDNAYGALGLGNNTNYSTPQQIPGLTLAPADLQLTAAATATLGTQWLMSLTRNYAGVAHLYAMDASFGGTWPGIVVPCWGAIPLNPPYLNVEYGALLPGTFNNFIGIIAANQTQQAWVNLPNFPVLTGLTMHACALTLDSFTATGLGKVTLPVAVTLQ